MPECPSCHKEIDTIYTSRTVHLKHKDGNWVEEQADHYFITSCPECTDEFSGEDLDKLGVPEDIR